jgi:hypothetical protein
VLTRSLPAVRVAVCKEISRAMELRVRHSCKDCAGNLDFNCLVTS